MKKIKNPRETVVHEKTQQAPCLFWLGLEGTGGWELVLVGGG